MTSSSSSIIKSLLVATCCIALVASDSLVGRLVLECDYSEDSKESNQNAYLDPLTESEIAALEKSDGDDEYTAQRVPLDGVNGHMGVNSIVKVSNPNATRHRREKSTAFAVSSLKVIARTAGEDAKDRVAVSETHEFVLLRVTIKVGSTLHTSAALPGGDITEMDGYFKDISYGNVNMPTSGTVETYTSEFTTTERNSNSYCDDSHANDNGHLAKWLDVNPTVVRSNQYCSASTIYYYSWESNPEGCALHCMKYEKNCKFIRYRPSDGLCYGYKLSSFSTINDCSRWVSASGQHTYRIDFGSNKQLSVSKYNDWYHNDEGKIRVLVFMLPESRDVTGSTSNDCNFCGRASIGGNPTKAYLDGDVSSNCLHHEIGHTLGAGHSRSVFDNDQHPDYEGSVIQRQDVMYGQGWSHSDWFIYSNYHEYGDKSSVMGTAFDGVGANAPTVALLGWLDSEAWIKDWSYPSSTANDCKQTFVLGSLSRPASRDDGFCPTKLITFERGTYNGEKTFYHISYRSIDRDTRDKGLQAPFGDAVFVHWSTGSLDTAEDGTFLVGAVGPNNQFESRGSTPGPNFRVAMIGETQSCYDRVVGASNNNVISRNEVLVEVDFCPTATWPSPSEDPAFTYSTVANGKACYGGYYYITAVGNSASERADFCAQATWDRREGACNDESTDEFYGVFVVTEFQGSYFCRMMYTSTGGGNSCKTCQTYTYSDGSFARVYALDTPSCFDGNYPAPASDPEPLTASDGECLGGFPTRQVTCDLTACEYRGKRKVTEVVVS